MIATLTACFGAILAGRVLAITLPLRLRPIHDPALEITLPLGMEAGTLEGWSSFPSDHAALFFALASGLFLTRRPLGVIALIYTFLFIALPRIYTGLHYPTDILGGALLGVLIAYLCHSQLLRKTIGQPILNFSQRWPEYFYPVLFLISYQIADMFNGSREILARAKDVIHMLLND